MLVGVYCEEYLRTTASELGIRRIFSFLKSGRVYKNYTRITPECFDQLFVLLDVIYTFS